VISAARASRFMTWAVNGNVYGSAPKARLMPLIRIESLADPRLAAYRQLADSELMRDNGLFVAEGRLVLRRIVDAGRFTVRSVLLNDTNFQALSGTLQRLPRDVPVFRCDTGDFLHITGFNLHRGCLALVERPIPTACCEILRAAHTIVILEGVGNADNVGGVFRNVAAFGADGVILSPNCCDPLYRKAIRTSMGATAGVAFARVDDWPGGLADVRATGFTIVALTPRRPSKTLDELLAGGRPARLALLVGTEGDGLSDGAAAMADLRVRIPISEGVDSLNLAVATGIALARLSHVGGL
jgi:tRNA G18 (ribose-2'-O)-methylase SpoU